jgi:hypothetical protein
MTDEKATLERIRSLIEGDGTAIRGQFLLAGLLLTIFERFKKYVVNKVDGFFANDFDLRDGMLHFVRGEKFKQMIKEKGTHLPGQHANKEFRAALHWFLDLNAITQAEFDDVERLYARRNEIGHELLEILADHRKQPIELVDILMLFAVYVKIVRWWIKEVEASTDPEMSQEQYDSTDWDEAESFDTMFLRQIIHKVLAGIPEWEQIKDALQPKVDPVYS